jgi:hypothetical protein
MEEGRRKKKAFKGKKEKKEGEEGRERGSHPTRG